MRLIDAEALMKEANEEGAYGYVDVTQIANAPTIETKPVVHAHWIEKEKYSFGIMYDCSLCDNRILDNGYSWNYCPNCGAQMDESEDKNEIF